MHKNIEPTGGMMKLNKGLICVFKAPFFFFLFKSHMWGLLFDFIHFTCGNNWSDEYCSLICCNFFFVV